MLPFPNNVETFTITGAKLKIMIEKLQNGAKKFIQIEGYHRLCPIIVEFTH
jgi:2',3'-cyclic-nucleotide 2'-phosphodiesterase (5'-nucleotidase family)